MARPKNPSQMVTVPFLTETFGIKRSHLTDLGLKPVTIDGEQLYPLDDAMTRCKQMVAKTAAAFCDYGSIMDADEIKTAKAIEAARKLKLENDALEQGLIDAETYAADYAEKVAAVRAIIAEISDMLGDIDPAALAIVRDAVADAVAG
ncbi:MAG: hypothetical protein ABJP34_10620 [Erythrobacter sp.]